jgi:hypothetical protein
MKSYMTISRHWDNPKINAQVSVEGISLITELDDFISALKKEIGSITMTFTQQQFSDKVDKAVEMVVAKIKQESVKVVT